MWIIVGDVPIYLPDDGKDDWPIPELPGWLYAILIVGAILFDCWIFYEILF